jgi:hypothetical protein
VSASLENNAAAIERGRFMESYCDDGSNEMLASAFKLITDQLEHTHAIAVGEKWQPIDTAPRDRYVAAWCPARRMSFQVIYGDGRQGWCVIGDRYPFTEEFTYWQPMPEGPQ